MYNILKRPMFKLGGQADQGSGIMSHVEPRQNYMFGNIAQPLTPFQTAYSDLQVQGYAMGGRIGYANGPGPVQVSDPFTYFAPNKNLPGTLPTVTNPLLEGRRKFDEEQRAIQQANREQLGIASLPVKKEEEGFLSSIFGPGADEKLLIEKGILSPNATAREKVEAVKNLKLARTTGTGTEDIAPPRESKITKTREPEFDETNKTNPRNDIRKEADMLKGLLKDEGLTTAENALVIARALAVPGGINAKIAAAAELAMPLIKERSKIDREAVLKAYETSKEIKKAEIAAGKKDAASQFTEDYVANKIKIAQESKDGVVQGEDGITRYRVGNEYKTRAEIERDFLNIRGQIVPASARVDLSQRISDAERQINILSGQKQNEQIKKQIELKQEEIRKARALLRGEFKTGGRVNKAYGGMSMDETTTEDTTGDKTETIVDTNVEGFPMKPVQKLSFEEIRSRLPREITDDIVKLISNSSEALQDFAYIKTQQDVNQFNVKYGVNLVLPQNV
jgi:TolA-binding protein